MLGMLYVVYQAERFSKGLTATPMTEEFLALSPYSLLERGLEGAGVSGRDVRKASSSLAKDGLVRTEGDSLEITLKGALLVTGGKINALAF